MNTYTKEQLIKKAVKYSTTEYLRRRKQESYKSVLFQMLYVARAINEKNELKYSRENVLLDSLIISYNFDKIAFIEKKIYNKRFINKRYLKVK